MFKHYFQWITLQKSAFFLASVLFVAPAFAVNINVSVDRNPVVKNESFKLIFTAAESPDDDPDFLPLNATLDVLNQRKNSQSSWVNGESTKRITWTLDVMPKVIGQLTIPPVMFGDDVTSALTINVLASSPTSSSLRNDALFLEAEVTPNEVYVQSQIVYTIRLYQRVQISQAALTEPKLDNAIIEKLGDDKQFNTQINGVNYAVFERNYAIFPQQSGPLIISPIELTAQIVTGAPRSRFGSVFNSQQQTKRVHSNGVSINVLPVPDTFTASHWLAAESIQLQQTWSNDGLTVPVGEPLTRTISLLGKGVSSSQLPDLVTEQTSSDIKMYPDQPLLRDQRNIDGVIALREQKIAIIPSKTGRYQIPAINIPWFNTKTQQMETATIPAVTVIAVASTSSDVTGVIPQATQADIATGENALPDNSTQYWMWAAIFLAIAWAATLVWIVVQRRNKKLVGSVNATPKSAPASLKILRKACAENNPQEAMQALLNWAESQYGTRQLNGLNPYINDELQAEINRLNQSLYANKKQAWNGSKLIRLVEANAKSKTVESEVTNPLQGLHRI